MKYRFTNLAAALLIGIVLSSCAAANDWWASEVVSYSRLGNSPYDNPLAVLGKPSTWMNSSGSPNDTYPCAVSMVSAAWNVGLTGEKLITTIKTKSSTLPAGQITVKFAAPIYDDPQNWYGKDFIAFGNGFFNFGGSYVYSSTDMDSLPIYAYSEQSGFWEPMPVSVSQDGVTWYSFANGPYADDYAPTQAFAWDWVENRWLKNSAGTEVELEFTRPVDPSLTVTSFNQKSVAQGIDLYKGSGGGTAFDLEDLPDLPADPGTGLKWIQYVKVDGTGGEVDAFARVSHQIAPISIGEAKKLDDGTNIVLSDVVVSSETYATGRSCYIQQADRSSGIKLMGRILGKGQKLSAVYGKTDTIGGERVILATSVLAEADEQGNNITADVRPLGMTNNVAAGTGLSTKGLLVRTCGRVKSVDSNAKSFVVGDGSNHEIKCLAPRNTKAAEPNNGLIPDPDFVLPGEDDFVVVTGINSSENTDNQQVSIIMLRSSDDMQIK
ncbi:MAG: hypothetical protein ABFD46_00830 [Armatimonadota bacterium]